MVIGTLLALVTLLFIAIRYQEGSAQKPALISHAPKKAGVRNPLAFDEKLAKAVDRYKATERITYSPKAPYNLSDTEVDEFLAKRGKTATSLLFVLICAGDRALLPEVANLPESPLKHLILADYGPDEEKLTHIRRLHELDPDNGLGLLCLADSLVKNQQPDEAGKLLEGMAGSSQMSGYQNQLMQEFEAACGIFGEQRGMQMVELHADHWATTRAGQITSLYLASVVGGDSKQNFTPAELLALTDQFLINIGVPDNRRREMALMRVRDCLVHWKDRLGNDQDELKRHYDELSTETNVEFLAGFKDLDHFNSLSDDERNAVLRERYFPSKDTDTGATQKK